MKETILTRARDARRSRFFVRSGVALSLMMFAIWLATTSARGISREADLFSGQRVCRIQIELTPHSMDRLRVDSRKYVPANIRVSGEVFHDVGVHLKGSTGSFRSLDDKPGFTVDFGRFSPGQKLRGVQRIHLNNSVEDATYLKDQIGSELFRAAQVPVPRVAHALVELNGRALGLYVLKEGLTEEFLTRHFERADGNLYDTDLGHDVNLRMKQHLGQDSGSDQLDLQRLVGATAEPDLPRRWEALHEALDVDRFLSLMVMEVMICHWDGYCLGRNNFRIYNDPSNGKLVFLPSGMDQIFAKADMPWKPDVAGLVARAIMEVPEGRQQYARRFQALLDTLFVSERLTNRVHQLLTDLRPALTWTEFEKVRREGAELCVQIAEREINLKKQLSQPEPVVPEFKNTVASLARWKTVNEPVGGKLHEGRSADEEPALRIVAGTNTSASWRTTVRLSRGHYGFRGQAKVTDVTPLPFGKNQGASLRVAGKAPRSSTLTGASPWEPLEVDFEVSTPEQEIELVCELRASAGEAWFDKGSLVLVRLR